MAAHASWQSTRSLAARHRRNQRKPGNHGRVPGHLLIPSGRGPLDTIAAVADELGECSIADEARATAVRSEEGRYYVACIGQFKRGKSTLLDALLGEPLLPVGVVPVTAVPTIVRFGRRGARVSVRGDGWRSIPLAALPDYVDEARNPGNAKRVEIAEVFAESETLAGGMCLVDTPGVGSVHAENTKTALAFVPQIDAAIVVLGADPPIAAEELAFIEATSARTSSLLFVIGKADRTSPADREVAAGFTRKVLQERLGRDIGPIFNVSPRCHLEGLDIQDDWEELRRALAQLGGASQALLSNAVGHAVRRLRNQLLARLTLERQMLLAPMEENQRRMGRLSAIEHDARRALDDLGALLRADENRLVQAVGKRRAAFMHAALEQGSAEFDQRFVALPGGGQGLHRAAFQLAEAIVESQVMPWLRSEAQIADQEYRGIVTRFDDVAARLSRQLEECGVTAVHWSSEDVGLSSRSEFFFHSFERLSMDGSPVRFVVNAARGLVGAREGIRREALAFLERLIEANTSRVEFDLRGRLRASRERFEADVMSAVARVWQSATESLARAAQAREEGAAAIAWRRDHLDKLAASLPLTGGPSPSGSSRNR